MCGSIASVFYVLQLRVHFKDMDTILHRALQVLKDTRAGDTHAYANTLKCCGWTYLFSQELELASAFLVCSPCSFVTLCQIFAFL